MPELGPLTVVTGHYGSGKTNLSINLALDLARTGARVTVVDLDIVNPYFRSSDSAELLARHGIELVGPTFAGTTLDTPSLPASMSAAFERDGYVIADVGGDDVGATAVGRFAEQVGAREHQLLYVVNRYRNLTATPEEAAALLAEIERTSHLQATGVVNNSHLQSETTVATVLDSVPYAQRTAELLGLPLVATTVPARLAAEFSERAGDPTFVDNAYPIHVYVRTPWQDAAGADEEA